MAHIEFCAPTLEEAVEDEVNQGATAENNQLVLCGIFFP